MAAVHYPNGSYKRVKNLGWLLRHWKEVDNFEVNKRMLTREEEEWSEAVLIANMADGSRFRTTFVSKEVLWNWLKRPVFIGLHVNWFGKEYVISRGGWQEPP